MKKMTKIAIALCAVSLTAALGFIGLTKYNQTDNAMERELKYDEGLKLIMMEGTVLSMENGELMIDHKLGDSSEEVIVTVPEGVLILDAVNGYPIPAEELSEGVSVNVYAGEEMTMSLPPIVNGSLVLADPSEEGEFPVYTTVKKLKKNSDGSFDLKATDGNTYTVNADTALLPYLTRNIVRTDDLTPGKKLLIWKDSHDGKNTAAKIVIFAGDDGI